MNARNRSEGLRLGFVSALMCYDDGQNWWTPPPVGRLLDCLLARTEKLTVAIPNAKIRASSRGHRLCVPRGDILTLPPMPSTARSLVKGGACRRTIREVERRSDVVIVQLPFTAPTGVLG